MDALRPLYLPDRSAVGFPKRRFSINAVVTDMFENSRYQGACREFYCSLTKLTPSWIAKATKLQLKTACSNLGIAALGTTTVAFYRSALTSFLKKHPP